jgi:hypothetical protein
LSDHRKGVPGDWEGTQGDEKEGKVMGAGESMNQNQPVCIVCGAVSKTTPLLPFLYQDQPYYICAQHLPILIHKPAQLADKLPGMELIAPLEEH